MKVAAALFVILLGAQGAFAQPGEGPPRPPLASGLAEDRVEVKVNYSGMRVVLFVTAPPDENETSGLAVALIGPSAPHQVVRRTAAGERRFEFEAAPTIFAIGAEPQIIGAVSPEIMMESGLNAAASAMPRSDQLMSPDLEDWRRAFVDLKMEQGLYFFSDTTIERLDGGLRRARISLPPNAPPGEYRVRAVAFRNGQRVGEVDQVLTLVRSGLEATLFDLSRQHGVIYGLLAILLAVAVGAVAAWVGRR
jgi:uncharacterized protein (TIGR02186 family)